MEEIIASLSKANNHFALSLHKSFAIEGGNVFFSPFSISTALAMLFNGARGDTALEMRHVLGYDTVTLSDDQVQQSFENLLTTMREKSDAYTLAIANALLTQKDFPFVSQYKEELQKIYRALAREVDFVKEADKVVNDINEWVKENTGNMIPKLLNSLNPSTVMVLLNAVYFKGTWQSPFDPECNTLKPFYNNGVDDKLKTIPMMCMEGYWEFLENDTFKALELPYKGRNIVMLLLLPHKRNGREELEQNLTLDFINTVRKSLSQTEVKVNLPKFRLEYVKEMSDVLKKLGMKSVFSGEANLKGLCGVEGLSVSEVLHKAVVEVNEEGTEAAAATCIAISNCLIFNQPSFVADHPFIFFIIDNVFDLILFMGRVEEL